MISVCLILSSFIFVSNCNKRRGKFWSQLCIGYNTGKAGESVPERVDELWIVGDERGGELALLLPAARRVDQHLHLRVVKSVELVSTAPNVELVEILRINVDVRGCSSGDSHLDIRTLEHDVKELLPQLEVFCSVAVRHVCHRDPDDLVRCPQKPAQSQYQMLLLALTETHLARSKSWSSGSLKMMW